MIAQQRLIGNIKGRGHGQPLLSPAFPLDSSLSTADIYRLPDVGKLPAQASRTTEDGRFRVLVTTFELQATHFGRAMLISSNIFRPAEANSGTRPNMYMNTVAMTDDSGAPLAFVPPETLLLYDGFITPAVFDTFNATTTGLTSAPFMPAAAPERRPFFAPNTPAHHALLNHYWAAASRRLWAKNASGFSICLGEPYQCLSLIEGAKALLLSDILAYLPPAVSHIASISAGVPLASTTDVFKDSALVVVFPTGAEVQQPTFDLRKSGAYPRLSEIEDQFISAVLAGQTIFMNDAVGRCMRLKGVNDPAQISFAADYDFAFTLYMLEQRALHGQNTLNPSQCVNAWMQLNQLLITRHGFSARQSNEILSGIEAKLMPLFAGSEELLHAIDGSVLPALWQKALTVSDDLFTPVCDVIVASPAVPDFPKMPPMYPNIGEEQQRRTAQLIQRITTESYAARPFDAQLVASLLSESFVAVAQKQPGIPEALYEGVSRNDTAFPGNLLVTLPLSSRLKNGDKAFDKALDLLDSQYTAALPEPPLVDNLRDAYALFTNERTHARLCQYFAACLPAYAQMPGTLAAAAAHVLPRTDAVLACILEKSDKIDLLFTAQQADGLFSTLLPSCEHPKKIGALYAKTESALSHRLGEAPLARLERLCALVKYLHATAYDATNAVVDMLNAFGRSRQLLASEQAEAFVTCLWPLCADQNRVTATFQAYLSGIVEGNPFYYFQHVETLRSLTPFIRTTQTDMTQTLCSILDACANSNPCVPLDQVNALIGELQPRCHDSAKTTNSLLHYADASRLDCQKRSVDGFTWLYGYMQIMEEKGLMTGDTQATMASMAIDHLSSIHDPSCHELPDQAYAWFTQMPGQRALFAHVQKPVLALLNSLVSNQANTGAQKCLDILRGSLASTAEYPELQKLDQSLTCRDFKAALTTQPYAQAMAAMRKSMQRCKLTPLALLNATAKDAETALRREFAPLKNPDDLMAAHLSGGTDPQSAFHNQVLAAVFTERYPAYKQACSSIEQLNQLNEIARKIGSTAAKSDAISGKFRSLMDQIGRPGMSFTAFPSAFDAGIRTLQQSRQDAPQVRAMLEEAVSRSIPQYGFPRSLLAAILCVYQPEGDTIDWPRVFTLLGLKADSKLPAPYSAEGQVWLAAIHAVFRALDSLPSSCCYAAQFMDVLNSGPFSDFTRAAQSDKKHQNFFFPEDTATSPLLRQWLNR